ncbi:glycosyltransferase [Aquimarina agarivorans]|uniref:glycosyltransferase n=1 Tax=Aquimarina agarivorans TaxID=980584 RepID=UPI0011107927
MVSILIPVFNYSLKDLLFFLTSEMKLSNKKYEIIILDDCSTNQKIERHNKKTMCRK